MLKRNSELRAAASKALEGKWAMAAVATLIYAVIGTALQCVPMVEYLYWLITLPLGWGLYILFHDVALGKPLELRTLFDGFKTTDEYLRILLTGLLVAVYTLLWTLLLIIPGIIKSISYSMVYYVLRDNPELRYNAAIELSMKMMEGNKMKFFLLCLSFIGWALLCILTLGLGFFLLIPYMYVAMAAFYEDVKQQYAARLEAGDVTVTA